MRRLWPSQPPLYELIEIGIKVHIYEHLEVEHLYMKCLPYINNIVVIYCFYWNEIHLCICMDLCLCIWIYISSHVCVYVIDWFFVKSHTIPVNINLSKTTFLLKKNCIKVGTCLYKTKCLLTELMGYGTIGISLFEHTN
jgi:hypothetical protein